MEPFDTEPPRHSVIDSEFDTTCSSITVMCNGVKFIIEVEAEALAGTIFGREYHQLAEHLRDDDNDEYFEAMCDWMVRPCFPIFRTSVSPISQGQQFTIQDYYYPRTLRLRLVLSNGHLIAERSTIPHLRYQDNLTIPSTELPEFLGVPRIRASTLSVVLDQKHYDDCCEIPRKVRTFDGIDCYFKTVFDRSQHIREIVSLTSITQAHLDNLRTSRLVGIVISDDAKATLGLVVEWIPSMWDLQSLQARRHKADHTRWRNQIAFTVETLHRNNIVWGDVHPGNILIDVHMDAWVIDFGGGWIEPFVPRRLRDTFEGDLHGIRKVFEYLKDEEVTAKTESQLYGLGTIRQAY